MVSALMICIAVMIVATAAEWLHSRRVRRVAYLAFGPSGRPAAWVALVPTLRVIAMGAVASGAVLLCRYEPILIDVPRPARASRQLLICLDVSPSMRISDAGPSKPKVSRAEWVGKVLQAVVDRVGSVDTRITLIAFYTKALPVLVDTADLNLVHNALRGMPYDIAFQPGKTDLSSGVSMALEMARPWARDSTILIVATDGDANDDISLPRRPPAIADTLVIGVGNPFRTEQIAGHASRQEVPSLKLLAARLGGVYIDANERFVPPAMLRATNAVAPQPVKSWGDREWGLLALTGGASVFTVLSAALSWFGLRRSAWARRAVNGAMRGTPTTGPGRVATTGGF